MPTPEPERGTILVLSDAPDLRLLYRAILERSGYRITTGPVPWHPAAALPVFHTLATEALLIDDFTTDNDPGWQLLDLLREDPELNSLPIVGCTTALHRLDETRPRFRQLRVEVLPKPLSITELRATMARALARTGAVSRATNGRVPPADLWHL